MTLFLSVQNFKTQNQKHREKAGWSPRQGGTIHPILLQTASLQPNCYRSRLHASLRSPTACKQDQENTDQVHMDLTVTSYNYAELVSSNSRSVCLFIVSSFTSTKHVTGPNICFNTPFPHFIPPRWFSTNTACPMETSLAGLHCGFLTVCCLSSSILSKSGLSKSNVVPN